VGDIPLKIADPSGALCHKVSCLVGMYRSKDSIFKEVVDLSELALGEVCTKFTAIIDKPSKTEEDANTTAHDIKNGENMQNILFGDVYKDKKIKFEVSEGRLVF